jgi:hypothetical protein
MQKVMKKTIYSLAVCRILLVLTLLAGSSFTEPGVHVFAQGIYSRNKAASETETGNKGDDNNSNNNQSEGSLFRAGSNMGGAQPSKVSPLKDGWEILLIAGIGYGFCIARRKKN